MVNQVMSQYKDVPASQSRSKSKTKKVDSAQHAKVYKESARRPVRASKAPITKRPVTGSRARVTSAAKKKPVSAKKATPVSSRGKSVKTPRSSTSKVSVSAKKASKSKLQSS